MTDDRVLEQLIAEARYHRQRDLVCRLRSAVLQGFRGRVAALPDVRWVPPARRAAAAEVIGQQLYFEAPPDPFVIPWPEDGR